MGRSFGDAAFFVERVAAEEPDDCLSIVAAGEDGYLGVGLYGDFFVPSFFDGSGTNQSAAGRRSGLVGLCAFLASSNGFFRLGQRIPPPAPPEAKWAHCMWRKYSSSKGSGRNLVFVLEGVNGATFAVEEGAVRGNL